MKKSLIVVAVLAAAPLLSHATVITSNHCGGETQNQCTASWSDYYNNPTFISKNDTSGTNDGLTWLFDLTKDGFNVGADTVYKYSLGLNFSDDIECIKSGRTGCKKYGYDIQQEYASVQQGGQTWKFEVDPGIEAFKGTVSGVAELNTTGTLKLTLSGLRGDFFFLDGALQACGKDKGTSVPEPSSIALLAAGLLGIGVMRRKNG